MYALGLGVRRDWKKAIEWYGKGAQKGHVNATINWAMVRLIGRAPINKEVLDKLRILADQGYPEAQLALGMMILEVLDGLADITLEDFIKELKKGIFRKGIEILLNSDLNKEDKIKNITTMATKEAMYWIRKASIRGFVPAQSFLFLWCFDPVIGEMPDTADCLEGIEWLAKSAENGFPLAQLLIAAAFSHIDPGAIKKIEEKTGIQVPRNLALAYALARMAKINLDTFRKDMEKRRFPIDFAAFKELDRVMAEYRAKMTSKEIITAEKLFRELQKPGNFYRILSAAIRRKSPKISGVGTGSAKETSSSHKDNLRQPQPYNINRHERIIPDRQTSDVDTNKTLKTAKEQYEKGLHYYNVGDYERAREWFLKAAQQGYAHAQALLGELYQRGLGGSKSYSAAYKWYRKAAAQRHPLALYYLAKMFEQGAKVPRDLRLAYALYAWGDFRLEKERIRQKMAPPEITMAERILESMKKPGNFLNTLDTVAMYGTLKPKKE